MAAESSFAFEDFDSLISTIAEWLARPNDPDLLARVPDFVWLAECEIQQKVEFRLRDLTATGTAVADQKYIDLPADYVSGKFFQWDNTNLPAIEVWSWEQVIALQKRGGSAITRAGTVHGSRLYVAPAAGAEPWTLYYKGGVTHLGKRGAATEVESNILLTEYPATMLYGALKHSAPWLGADERIKLWQELFTDSLKDADLQEWNAHASHGPLRMKPDVQVY